MKTGTVLDRIAESTRVRVRAAKSLVPEAALRERISKTRAPKNFLGAFQGGGLRVVAEIKRASPSRGAIGAGLDPVAVARAYADAGAAAISVLTEPEFFDGDVSHLASVRRAVGLPILMKDFFVDPYQLFQARVYGADCVLLIAALLGPDGVRDMLARADGLGLTALVEVHDEDELESAFAAGARLIGVNNRDLKTLKTDLEVSRRLAPKAAGRGARLICESGLGERAQLAEMRALGFDGFLIGTGLIETGDPGGALAALLGRAPFSPNDARHGEASAPPGEGSP